MKFKNMKFDTNGSEDLSAEIQQALFKKGYGWILDGDRVQYTDARFLFADKKGCITKAEDDLEYFDNHSYPERTLTELLQSIPAVPTAPNPEECRETLAKRASNDLRIEVLEKQVSNLQKLLTQDHKLHTVLVDTGVITDDEMAMLTDLISRGGEE